MKKKMEKTSEREKKKKKDYKRYRDLDEIGFGYYGTYPIIQI